MKQSLLIASLILSATTASAADSAVKFSEIESLKGSVQQKTEHYEIADTVKISGPYYVFEVKADHGEYEVESVAKLTKVCHDIRAIEEYVATPEGKTAWKGAKDHMRQIGQGAKAIVKNPKESGKAIGRALGKTGRQVKNLIKSPFGRKKKKKEAEEEAKKQAKSAGGMMGGKQARTLAYKLQVDVYTDNPYMRGLLDSVAKQEAKGSLGVSAALFVFAPVAGLGYATKGALTPGAYEEQTELLIRDNHATELKYQLRKKFGVDFDLDKRKDKEQLEELQAFLDNPNYTPREVAYGCLYLTRMKDAKGIRETVNHLAAVSEQAAAQFLIRQLELYSAAHQGGQAVAELMSAANRIVAVGDDGKGFALAPYDLAAASESMIAERDALAAGNVKSLKITGDADQAFAEQSAGKGIAITGLLLREDAFRAK